MPLADLDAPRGWELTLIDREGFVISSTRRLRPGSSVFDRPGAREVLKPHFDIVVATGEPRSARVFMSGKVWEIHLRPAGPYIENVHRPVFSFDPDDLVTADRLLAAPRDGTAESLAEALGITVEELRNGDDEEDEESDFVAAVHQLTLAARALAEMADRNERKRDRGVA